MNMVEKPATTTKTPSLSTFTKLQQTQSEVAKQEQAQWQQKTSDIFG